MINLIVLEDTNKTCWRKYAAWLCALSVLVPCLNKVLPAVFSMLQKALQVKKPQTVSR
jgi:hypothetical protein